ncbi:hypothetical protein C8Q72DRAFT_827915 [Fomitopsis betulina]|nr:hypothetical protein C8Q72DRAFT_827915 [Fomitopsis betulina]
MATQQLCEGVQNLNLHDNDVLEAQPDPGNQRHRLTVSNVVSGDAEGTSDLPIRLPRFHSSANPQMSADLRLMLQIPRIYTRTARPLFLGWRAPTEETEQAIYRRYKKKYGLETIHMSHVYRFAELLNRHLRSREMTPERCLFRDVTLKDAHPHDAEEDRSFDCISIATTWQYRHRLGPRLSEEQFRWLVQYFGELPAWYYHYEPTYM